MKILNPGVVVKGERTHFLGRLEGHKQRIHKDRVGDRYIGQKRRGCGKDDFFFWVRRFFWGSEEFAVGRSGKFNIIKTTSKKTKKKKIKTNTTDRMTTTTLNPVVLAPPQPTITPPKHTQASKTYSQGEDCSRSGARGCCRE